MSKEKNEGAPQRSALDEAAANLEREPVPGQTENLPIDRGMHRDARTGAVERGAPGAETSTQPRAKPVVPPGTPSERRGGSSSSRR